SHVANTLRLLKLPQSVRDMITDGSLTAGHARTLVTATDPEGLAKRIIEEGLSVRQAEALAATPDSVEARTTVRREKDADTRSLEKLLSDHIGLKVAINHKEKGGELRVAYKTLEQLDELCRLLQR